MFPVMPWVVLFIYILLFTFHGLVLYSTAPEKVFLFSTTFAVHRVRKHGNSWLREQMGKPSEACPTSLKVNRQETRDEWISVYPVPQIFNEWKMFFWILFRSDVANYRYLYLTESTVSESVSVSPRQWVPVSVTNKRDRVRLIRFRSLTPCFSQNGKDTSAFKWQQQPNMGEA